MGWLGKVVRHILRLPEAPNRNEPLPTIPEPELTPQETKDNVAETVREQQVRMRELGTEIRLVRGQQARRR
jgi:hypothetical protein